MAGNRLMDPNNQFDRIEHKLDLLWSRVDHLERRASFWGAFAGVVTAFFTKFTGCV